MHDARAGDRTGFFIARPIVRARKLVRHIWPNEPTLQKRNTSVTGTPAHITRTPSEQTAVPYPPRAARNSCGVVPVCLRKNRAK